MKQNAEKIKELKGKKKITMLTAYDSLIASIVDAAGIDLILVGDSLGMVALGYDSTIPVTLSDILHHTRAVSRVVKQALVIADMPFLTFGISPEETLRNAGILIQTGRADAVKMEGAHPKTLESIEFLVARGIPVMGHIGLTPQAIKSLNGYKTQGTTLKSARKLMADAENLERAGCFSIVLEKIPFNLAKLVTESIDIPTIGIGAGKYCDGQVLVIYDMLGIFEKFIPKFVKKYANIRGEIIKAVGNYKTEVETSSFPDASHSFEMDEVLFNRLKNESNNKN